MVAKVIPLSRSGRLQEAEPDDFEAWEDYAELIERGNFPGLVRFCEAQVRRRPRDVYAHYYLGDAYLRNGQPQQAIEFLTPLHRADPDQTAYHKIILDALFALGRTEGDFAWVIPPRVSRLSPEILDASYAHLRGKRRPRLAVELMVVVCDGYWAFSEDDLLAALRGDVRFVVEDADVVPGVRVARGRARRDRWRERAREPQG